MTNLTKWDYRYLNLAFHISEWSSCLRRKVGAVLVKNNHIIATGYNGAPSNVISCTQRNCCIRDENHIEHGTRQEFCYAVHAEQNAICQAAKFGANTEGSILYCTHSPCSVCAKILINAGVKRIVFKELYNDELALRFLQEAGIEIEQVSTT